VLGLFGLVFPHLVTRWLFQANALLALALLVDGLLGLGAPPQTLIAPLGLPGLPFHLALDPLAAFFLVVLGALTVGTSLFSIGYFRAMPPPTLGLLFLEHQLFLASLVFVFVAADAYLFMLAWESMALSSYFLVTTDHKIPEIRRAGFLYLLIAHVGAIAILLCFGVMQGGHGDYAFTSLRNAHLSAEWASVVFVLALVGFGAKAGFVPLHVWLPEAHPAAPSPVSALMSGIMLKTAVYGLLRITFDLLPMQLAWWGPLTLGIGLVTAVFGVMFAAVQTDMKRLLAYSSIENLGIIGAGIGLTITFHAYGLNALAALALTATLYHTLNHALFKGLLFLGAGAVLHATAERSMARMGGFIHRMPWVAGTTLVGALAIAGLPPLNGFVSEWLLLQAFLLAPGLPQPILNMLVPIAAAAVVLAAALAGYVTVKFYGVIFLGQPRQPLDHVHDADASARLGLGWLAVACVVLGLFPVHVIQGLAPAVHVLVGETLPLSTSWLWLAPVSADRASYSPLIFLLVVASVVLLTFVLVRRFYHGRARRSSAWACGFPVRNARMQDTAEGFGQPIRHIFDPVFHVERVLPEPDDRAPVYRMRVDDRWWLGLYLPIARFTEQIASGIARLQHGRIHLYLLYSFLTLLVLLAFIR
jgi:hydrogenase-4 component B